MIFYEEVDSLEAESKDEIPKGNVVPRHNGTILIIKFLCYWYKLVCTYVYHPCQWGFYPFVSQGFR